MKKIVMYLICLMLMFSVNAFADVDVESGSNSEAFSGSSITDNSTNYIIDRKFVTPGMTPMPGTNSFLTTPTPDSSFRSIKDILTTIGGPEKYCIIIAKGSLKNMAKGGDVDVHLQIVRGENQVARVYGDDFEGTEYLYITIEKPILNNNGKAIGSKRIPGLIVTGLIDGEADDADTNSMQVIGKLGLKALADGNNYMVITDEGAHRMVEASGWGIGLYTVGGDVSDSGERSGVGGGGTGYAKNKSGTEDQPWIKGYVGVKDVPYPPDMTIK